MLSVEANSLNEVWLELLKHLYYHPEHEARPRGLKTREILGVTLRVTDLRNNILYHPMRNLNYKFQIAEWLWMAFGRDDLATLERYNHQMSRFSDDGKKLDGAYGPRLATQWQYIVDTLSKDYYSRQAVATIWTPNPAPSKDIPCTLSLQLIARLGMLNCIVTMRSSDVWLGLPYDVGTFGLLANGIAGVLGLHTGFLQFNLGSSHLYETDFEKVKTVIDDPVTYEGVRSPTLPYMPNPNPTLENPFSLQEMLLDPAKAKEFPLNYPWAMYADTLNASSWSEARRILSGERP